MVFGHPALEKDFGAVHLLLFSNCPQVLRRSLGVSILALRSVTTAVCFFCRQGTSLLRSYFLRSLKESLRVLILRVRIALTDSPCVPLSPSAVYPLLFG
jgi:hypothetical protein